MKNEDSLFKEYLQAEGKLNYIRGDKPNINCILCEIRDNNPNIESYKVYENQHLFITLNKYPYNPGHLMVVPSHHLERFSDLIPFERNIVFETVIRCQILLQDLFQPIGFNVGYNQGDCAGASLKHIHIHIVPRYKSELGYIDIIGQTRIVVEGIKSVYLKIKEKIHSYIQ